MAGCVEDDVYKAIDRSKSHEENVRVDWSEAAERLLMEECEDYVNTNDQRGIQFWGVDIDGNQWRVRLVGKSAHDAGGE